MRTMTYDKDADGIVTLTIDDPDQRVNTMNTAYLDDMEEAVARLEREEDLTGVIITSGKDTFFAGGDLRLLYQAGPDDAARVAEESTRIKRQLRRLETLGKPVVAALNGSALGGGLEIALACHHRIAVDEPRAKYGLPEVTLGLLPGGGGVVRVTRMLGLVSALVNVLAQGQQMPARKAHELGLLSELVASRDELLPAARRWIAEHPEARQPWDDERYKVPGGVPSHPKLAMMLPGIPSNLRRQLKGAPMPAPVRIMCAATESLQVPVDRAWEIETRYFTELVTGQVAKNMIKAFFFDLQHINGGGSRPDGHERWTATRVAVLGAGMMGAGIAHSCAMSGMDVVLKDVDLAAAEKGKDHSRTLLAKRVGRGRMTQEQADEVLARITPTASVEDLAGCDLVIEAVFESTELKHRVFGETEPVVAPDALLCSNTSSLPIATLAEGVSRPEDFIGLHFFSPVDKMPLVEIVRGRQTSDAAVARAFDVVTQLKKTPIVVGDGRGFFTSRVIGTFIMEALAMLAEGVNPVRIERAATMAGYPVGPLQLLDELTLTLPLKLDAEARAALGDAYVEPAGVAVLKAMVEQHGRTGKSGGAGFYDYVDDEGGSRRRAGLWPGLAEHFPVTTTLDVTDVQERMLVVEALETVKCLDEGILTSVPDANIGAIFGIGFPPWTGGPIQYIDGYEGGTTGFVARCKALADRYGDRFTPPPSLVAKAEAGEPLSPPPF